jgi:hypothetical protein
MTKPDWIMQQFVVYNSPDDYPGKYVLRRWWVKQGEPEPVSDPAPVIVATSLSDVRAAVPFGLYCVPRAPNDEPCVHEVWL